MFVMVYDGRYKAPSCLGMMGMEGHDSKDRCDGNIDLPLFLSKKPLTLRETIKQSINDAFKPS